MRELGAAEVRPLRVWARGVAGDRRARSVTEVMERCPPVRAPDVREAALGLRARGSGLAEADLRLALGAVRRVAGFARATRYLVPAPDAGRRRELLAPRLLRRGERPYRELGLRPDELALGERVVAEALADGRA
ncbi:hypothetical protein [Actinacidiphila yeochonensis]|uniref:hypothetical protein n=1 Tax=Actinacidiphila yeochonensis TaxID=89050 RepID=UPI00068F26C3|nr:hypothetical protein [Actinacidiphila yeochonensis]